MNILYLVGAFSFKEMFHLDTNEETFFMSWSRSALKKM